MYKATEIEYKRVNQMRSSYERKFAWMLSALLNKQWRAAANSIDVTNYRSAITGVVKRADTEKVIVNLYQSVGVSFARESYKRIKAREDEEMIDKWEQYMKQYARTDAGSRITSITQMTQAQIQRIVGGAVNRATDEGLGAVETAKAIRDSLREQGETINQWRALRIARTEVMTASNVGSLRGARDLGVPMNKIWIATLDDRTRDSHAAMNNVEVDINEDFKLPSGAVMDGPGDPAGGAEETINCRCSVAYRVKRGEVTGEREAGEGISITEPEIPVSPERAATETVEEFKPAATIKEAEQFIIENNIADSVSYTKATIDEANMINKTLLAANNYHGVRFNKISVGDVKSRLGTHFSAAAVYDANGVLKETKFFYNTASKKYIEGTLKMNYNDYILKTHNEGYWVAKTPEDMINHEVGHYLTNYKTIKEYRSDKLLMSFKGVNISKYGRSDGGEALAEIWSLYKREGAKSLKPEWIEFFNSKSPTVKIR